MIRISTYTFACVHVFEEGSITYKWYHASPHTHTPNTHQTTKKQGRISWSCSWAEGQREFVSCFNVQRRCSMLLLLGVVARDALSMHAEKAHAFALMCLCTTRICACAWLEYEEASCGTLFLCLPKTPAHLRGVSHTAVFSGAWLE